MATRHDEEVRREVMRLRSQGFSRIKADLTGFELPSPIGNRERIPDIEASKPGKTVLVELEEQSQLPSQKEQISAFKKSAAQQPRAEFRLRLFQLRKKGSRYSDEKR